MEKKIYGDKILKSTITSIPPEITQYYNRLLLTISCPLLRDSSKDLWKVYEYIVDRLMRKTKNLKKKNALCNQLREDFTNLYVKITQKEKELETKTNHPTKRPFYCITITRRNVEEIFRRLRAK